MPTAQVGCEKTVTGFLPQLVGASNIYGCGMLELGMSFSKEQLVIDDDIIGMMRYGKGGIEVNKTTLAYDSIKEVGIGNNFIGLADTINNVDLPSKPLTFDRHMYDEWKELGAKNDVEIAHERVLDILANHKCTPIEHRDLVDKVIKDADARYQKLKGGN